MVKVEEKVNGDKYFDTEGVSYTSQSLNLPTKPHHLAEAFAEMIKKELQRRTVRCISPSSLV
jgi:hypothetical protein